MSAWRQAGLNLSWRSLAKATLPLNQDGLYINFSNIAAKLLRQALKSELRAEAQKRADTHIKVTKWVNGKPIKESTF